MNLSRIREVAIEDLGEKTDVLDERQIYEALRGLIPEFKSGRFVDDAEADSGPIASTPVPASAPDGVAVKGASAKSTPVASQGN